MSAITLDHRNLMMLRYSHYKTTMKKEPVILRNPFNGEIIFVQQPLQDILKAKEEA